VSVSRGRPAERSLVGDDPSLWRQLDESCGYGAEAGLSQPEWPHGAGRGSGREFPDAGRAEAMLTQTALRSGWVIFLSPLQV